MDEQLLIPHQSVLPLLPPRTLQALSAPVTIGHRDLPVRDMCRVWGRRASPRAVLPQSWTAAPLVFRATFRSRRGTARY